MQSLTPGDVTKLSLFDYHGGDLQIMYSKGQSGIVSLTTAIRDSSTDIMISERILIDEIPERAVYMGNPVIVDSNSLSFAFDQEVVEFKGLNNEERRRMMSKLSQAIYYVTDSLTSEQIIIPKK